MELQSPQTFFKVGESYRMQLWVRDLAASRRPVGILLANGNYQNRPTPTSAFGKYDDREWHLLSKTFVATSTGSADTALHIALPASDALRFQVTEASVRAYQAEEPDRSGPRPNRVLDFNGPDGAAVDSSEWNYDTGGHGWGHAELQTYTSRRANSRVNGAGQLVITARRETFRGRDRHTRRYTSARLTTQGKVNVHPGSYVESSITPPVGVGMWPAFWLIGSNFPEVPWPACGELDIMEIAGRMPTIAHSSAHMASAANPFLNLQYGWGEAGGSTDLGHRLDSQAHRYGVYFDDEMVQFYIDRKPTLTVFAEDARATGRHWPFGKPQFIVVNVAIGSGAWNIDERVFPKSMTVGPIRIWDGRPF